MSNQEGESVRLPVAPRMQEANHLASHGQVLLQDVQAVEFCFDGNYLQCPEDAWEFAIAGETPEQALGMAGVLHEVREILALSAAHGWWPSVAESGEWVAGPIAEWTRDHPYSRKCPDLDRLLDRWSVRRVVIDAEPS